MPFLSPNQQCHSIGTLPQSHKGTNLRHTITVFRQSNLLLTYSQLNSNLLKKTWQLERWIEIKTSKHIISKSTTKIFHIIHLNFTTDQWHISKSLIWSIKWLKTSTFIASPTRAEIVPESIKGLRVMEVHGGDNWSYKTGKAPVKMYLFETFTDVVARL